MPARALSDAIAALRQLLGPLRVAPLYRTAPLAEQPQPDYLNTVVVATRPVGLEAEDVLAFAKALERRAGRRRDARDAPRPLDIDLLLFGNRLSARPALRLPHPRLRQRRFVLAPLADLVPTLRLPPDGAQVSDLLAALGSQQSVVRIVWSAVTPR